MGVEPFSSQGSPGNTFSGNVSLGYSCEQTTNLYISLVWPCIRESQQKGMPDPSETQRWPVESLQAPPRIPLRFPRETDQRHSYDREQEGGGEEGRVKEDREGRTERERTWRMMTGGMCALNPGESNEIYDWAEMLLYPVCALTAHVDKNDCRTLTQFWNIK